MSPGKYRQNLITVQSFEIACPCKCIGLESRRLSFHENTYYRYGILAKFDPEMESWELGIQRRTVDTDIPMAADVYVALSLDVIVTQFSQFAIPVDHCIAKLVMLLNTHHSTTLNEMIMTPDSFVVASCRQDTESASISSFGWSDLPYEGEYLLDAGDFSSCDKDTICCVPPPPSHAAPLSSLYDDDDDSSEEGQEQHHYVMTPPPRPHPL